MTKVSKTIILLCCSILVQLQCSLTANELHMWGRDWVNSGVCLVKVQTYWMCTYVIYFLSHVRAQRLPFCHVVPREVAKSRIDRAERRRESPQRDFQSRSPLATFLLLDYKPCHGTCPIHHRLLAPVTELNLWHSSLENVLQLLRRSIFVCMCTLGIVLDLFWCRVMTAFQCLLTSLRYKI